MFRKLHQKTLPLQSRVIIPYLSNQNLCQSRPISSIFTTFVVTPVQRIQRTKHLNFCTDRCDKKSDIGIKSNGDSDVSPIVGELQSRLQCTKSEAAEVYEMFSTNGHEVKLETIKKTARFLIRIGASMPVIVKNCHILLIPLDRLKRSHKILSRRSWDSVDDFVPLLIFSESKIKRIQLRSSSVIRDRVYFFKEFFSIEPHIISYYCSKHPFVFEIEFELLERKLNMLLGCNVSPENILRDLNVLARAEDVIKDRLEYLKQCGIERVMPWMIKCQDRVLHRAIEIRQNLGHEQNKTMELLTERLHWHGKTAISMFTKNKFLKQLNSRTASELLDELLKVFSPSEITANITLLSLNLSHVKIRVAELVALKAYPIPPKVLGMSDNSFKQYLNLTKNK